MRRPLLATPAALLVAMALAGPAGARDLGTIYIDDAAYRTFGNPAHVPDGTGTDKIATFVGSTNADQLPVAQYAPGSPIGYHGGRWAVYRATWTASGDPSTLVTSWGELEALVDAGDLTLARDPAADFRCPVLGDPEPIG
jgi:hypothetical protein